MTVNGLRRIGFQLHSGDAHDVEITDDHEGSRHAQRPPGRLLRGELEARRLSVNRLALDLGVPLGWITDILNGRRAISADAALRLSPYIGNGARFWLDLQSQYGPAVTERDRARPGSTRGRMVLDLTRAKSHLDAVLN